MTYVDWFNHRRLHGTITNGSGDTTRPPTRTHTTVRQPGPRAGHPNHPSSGTRGASVTDSRTSVTGRRVTGAQTPVTSTDRQHQLQPLVLPQLGQAWQLPARCIWTPHCMQ